MGTIATFRLLEAILVDVETTQMQTEKGMAEDQMATQKTLKTRNVVVRHLKVATRIIHPRMVLLENHNEDAE